MVINGALEEMNRLKSSEEQSTKGKRVKEFNKASSLFFISESHQALD